MKNLTTYQNGQISPIKEVTDDLFTQFIEYLDASEKTIETYSIALKQFFLYLQAHGIKQPDRSDIIAYRDDLKDSGHKPTTVQNYITAVKQLFKWTASKGIYPNIAENIKGSKLDRGYKKDYLTSGQVREILQTIDTSTVKGQRDHAIILLMVTGALRTIEVSRANVEDLRALGDETALYIQGKGKEEKTEYIKVPQEVENEIRKYLATRGELNGSEPLFASTSNNSKGNRLSTRTISKICKEAFKDAGYNSPKLTAHSLRHTAITLALLSGEDITQVQKFARHASINNTMIYNHAIEQQKNSCSQSIMESLIS